MNSSNMPGTNMASPRRSRSRVIGGIVVGLVVFGLLGGAVWYHATQPVRTVQQMFQDFAVRYDANATLNAVCPSARNDTSYQNLNQEVPQSIALLKNVSAVVTLDVSHLTYTIAQESFFGKAQVRIGGAITLKNLQSGLSVQYPFSQVPQGQVAVLESQGIGWCIDGVPPGALLDFTPPS